MLLGGLVVQRLELRVAVRARARHLGRLRLLHLVVVRLKHHVLHEHGDEARQEGAQQLRLQPRLAERHPELARLQRHPLVLRLVGLQHVLDDLVQEGLQLVGLHRQQLHQPHHHLLAHSRHVVVRERKKGVQVLVKEGHQPRGHVARHEVEARRRLPPHLARLRLEQRHERGHQQLRGRLAARRADPHLHLYRRVLDDHEQRAQ
mmetsp:Transcript_32172/g.81775  ORF Transcript_32172/g.81775 Transcript_32172/m.81775 type:complete len:204 (+) Transcript_32172:743-1354(+)